MLSEHNTVRRVKQGLRGDLVARAMLVTRIEHLDNAVIRSQQGWFNLAGISQFANSMHSPAVVNCLQIVRSRMDCVADDYDSALASMVLVEAGGPLRLIGSHLDDPGGIGLYTAVRGAMIAAQRNDTAYIDGCLARLRSGNHATDAGSYFDYKLVSELRKKAAGKDINRKQMCEAARSTGRQWVRCCRQIRECFGIDSNPVQCILCQETMRSRGNVRHLPSNGEPTC